MIDKPRHLGQVRAARTAVVQLPRTALLVEAARQFQAYRARHVGPTVAGLLGLDDSEKAALSNWRDLLEGDATEGPQPLLDWESDELGRR